MTDPPAGRYCKACKYDLRGSVDPSCPECGRKFDPDDPSTYLLSPDSQDLWGLRIVEWFALIYPLVAAASVKVCFLTNGLLLGYWPRQPLGPRAIDDRHSDSFIAIILDIITTLIIFMAIPVLAVSALILLLSFWMRGMNARVTKRSVLIWLGIITAWAVFYVDIHYDPWSMWDWFFD